MYTISTKTALRYLLCIYFYASLLLDIGRGKRKAVYLD